MNPLLMLCYFYDLCCLEGCTIMHFGSRMNFLWKVVLHLCFHCMANWMLMYWSRIITFYCFMPVKVAREVLNKTPGEQKSNKDILDWLGLFQQCMFLKSCLIVIFLQGVVPWYCTDSLWKGRRCWYLDRTNDKGPRPYTKIWWHVCLGLGIQRNC